MIKYNKSWIKTGFSRREAGMVILAPSILAADFANLERELDTIQDAGAAWAHVDVMDGHFVPNISIGVPVVKSLRRVTDLTLDVHLMVDRPLRFVEAFCKAGADYLTLHLEADTPENIRSGLRRIRQMGVHPALAIKPCTPAESLESFLTECDMVLVMTVEPGFGGQSLIPETLSKVTHLRGCLERVNPRCLLEVDGGVDLTTAHRCRNAGADVLVSGSGFFRAEDKRAFVQAMCDLGVRERRKERGT